MAWTNPRTWTDSELVTAAIMNTHVRDNLAALGEPKHAWKTGDTARQSTTAVANDPDLQVSLSSGQTWVFEAFLVFTDAGSGDMKIAINGPTSSVSIWGPTNGYWNTADGFVVTQANLIDGATTYAIGTSATARSHTVRGFITTTGSATPLAVMWAQNASVAANLTMKAGSHLIAKRLA
jgi:hypothetical protein